MDSIVNVIIIGAVLSGAAVVVMMVMRKKNPQAAAQVDAITSTAGDIAGQAVGALHNALLNAQEHLKNSVPAVTRTPIQPPAPVQPAPAERPPPEPPPAPVYTGPYRDINGNPDPLGQYQEYNWRQAKDARDIMSKQRATGPLNPASLTEADKSWLSVMGSAMTFDPRDLAYGNFYGEVTTALGGYGTMGAEALNDPVGFQSRVSPNVVQTVRELANGTGTWIPLAFVGSGGDVYLSQHKQGWHDGWVRVYGSEP